MSASNDNPTPPDDVTALAPFYVNGTLDAAERRRIEAALAEKPELEAEISLWRHVRDSVQADAAGRVSEQPAPSQEFAIARLLRDIRAERTAGPTRRSAGIGAVFNGRLRIARMAAAAALILMVGVTAGRIAPWDAPSEYRAAGEDTVAGEAAAGPVLRLAFRADAPVSEIEALLRAEGLTIVEGPSAIGLYRVRALDVSMSVDALLSRLRENDLVQSATPNR